MSAGGWPSTTLGVAPYNVAIEAPPTARTRGRKRHTPAKGARRWREPMSWADHDDALIAAWDAPGVVNVIGDLQVTG